MLHLRQAKIEHLDPTVGSDLHISGLEITVDDSFFVRFLDRLGHLPRYGQCFPDWQRTALQPFPESLTLHQFQHEKVRPLIRLETVNPTNVRMIESREGFSFTLKS